MDGTVKNNDLAERTAAEFAAYVAQVVEEAVAKERERILAYVESDGLVGRAVAEALRREV